MVSLDPPLVLIVGNDSPIGMVLKTALTAFGASVLIARTATEARLHLRHNDCAVVLIPTDSVLDNAPPPSDLLHGDETTRSQPVVFIGAINRAYERLVRRVLPTWALDGTVDVIETPIDDHALLSKLRVYFALDHMRRDLAHTQEQLIERTQQLEVERAKRRAAETAETTTAVTEPPHTHSLYIQSFNVQLARILKSVADGIYGVDQSGRITFANTAMERLTGWSCDDLIGTMAQDLLRDRDTKPSATDRKDRPLTVRSGLLCRANAGLLPVDYTVAPLVSDDQMDGAVVVVRDATERSRLETGLERARQVAEEANHAKSAFLAIMSHELRTPLNTILGFSEMIRDGTQHGAEPERYQDYANDIFQAGTHLLELINDILDLSKIEAGRMEIEPHWQDLRHSVAAVTRMVRERAHHQMITLVTDMEPNLPLLWADERAFKQILLNLLSNAFKFTPRGGRITIMIHSHTTGGIRVAVTDTGPGIPADQVSRLFQPFEQVDNRYNRAASGTGLGLSLTKGLVEIHGGRVDIESTVGIGTTVSFILPPGPADRTRLP